MKAQKILVQLLDGDQIRLPPAKSSPTVLRNSKPTPTPSAFLPFPRSHPPGSRRSRSLRPPRANPETLLPLSQTLRHARALLLAPDCSCVLSGKLPRGRHRRSHPRPPSQLLPGRSRGSVLRLRRPEELPRARARPACSQGLSQARPRAAA